MPDPIPAEAARPYRILVTGSRTWDDWATVWTALEDAVEQAYRQGHREYVVIHGGAKGADQIAANWCEEHAAWYDNASQVLAEERHPADWAAPCGPICRTPHRKRRLDGSTYCPWAGWTRNQAMVDLGADLCLAFILNNSRGTADCIRRAEKAGIPVRRHERSSRG